MEKLALLTDNLSPVHNVRAKDIFRMTPDGFASMMADEALDTLPSAYPDSFMSGRETAILKEADVTMFERMSSILLREYSTQIGKVQAELNTLEADMQAVETILARLVAIGYLRLLHGPAGTTDGLSDFVETLSRGISLLTLDYRSFPSGKTMEDMRRFILTMPQMNTLREYYSELLPIGSTPYNTQQALISASITPVLLSYYIGMGMWAEEAMQTSRVDTSRLPNGNIAGIFATSIGWDPREFDPDDFGDSTEF